MEILITVIPIAIMVVGCLWCRNLEKESWNNGVCKQTGDRWVMFDVSSQGCRGYKSGKYYTWITYGVDK